MEFAISFFIFLLIFPACSITTHVSTIDPSALTSEERANLAELQAMASRTTRIYDKPPVRLEVIPSRPPFHHAFAKPEQGLILFPSGLLSFGDNLVWGRLVMAHELAHYILGHSVSRSISVDQQQELEATRKAVEILSLVTGISEEEGVRRWAIFLRASQEQMPGHAPFPWHLPPCQELTELLKYYSQYRARIEGDVSRFANDRGWIRSC